MDKEPEGREQDQLKEHSLPGTNQAGKGANPGEKAGQLNGPREAPRPPHDQLQEHGLPGTNQAGKGPSPGDTNHEER